MKKFIGSLKQTHANGALAITTYAYPASRIGRKQQLLQGESQQFISTDF